MNCCDQCQEVRKVYYLVEDVYICGECTLEHIGVYYDDNGDYFTEDGNSIDMEEIKIRLQEYKTKVAECGYCEYSKTDDKNS